MLRPITIAVVMCITFPVLADQAEVCDATKAYAVPEWIPKRTCFLDPVFSPLNWTRSLADGVYPAGGAIVCNDLHSYATEVTLTTQEGESKSIKLDPGACSAFRTSRVSISAVCHDEACTPKRAIHYQPCPSGLKQHPYPYLSRSIMAKEELIRPKSKMAMIVASRFSTNQARFPVLISEVPAIMKVCAPGDAVIHYSDDIWSSTHKEVAGGTCRTVRGRSIWIVRQSVTSTSETTKQQILQFEGSAPFDGTPSCPHF